MQEAESLAAGRAGRGAGAQPLAAEGSGVRRLLLENYWLIFLLQYLRFYGNSYATTTLRIGMNYYCNYIINLT